MRDLQPWITLSSREILAVPNRLGIVKKQVQLPDGRVVEDFYQIQLLEETGFVADDKAWRSLGSFVVNGNQDCGKVHLFTAQGAHQIQDPDSNELEEIKVRLMTLEEVVQAVLNSDVATLASVATLALAMNPQFVKQ